MKFFPNTEVAILTIHIVRDYLRSAFIMRRSVKGIDVLDMSQIKLFPKINTNIFYFLLFSFKLSVEKKSSVSTAIDSISKVCQEVRIEFKLSGELM